MGEERRDLDELPTMPPPPARREGALRWASHPGTHRGPASPAPRARATGWLSSGGPPTLPLPEVPTTPGRPNRRFPVVVGIVLVAAVVAAGLAFGLSAGVEQRAPAHTGAPLAELAPPLAFEDLIGSLSGAGALAARAVAGACRVSAPASRERQELVSDLAKAASADRAVLSALSAAKGRLASWPAAPTLFGWTEKVAVASLAAAGDYQAWLLDLQATGCYSAPANNLHYLLALSASAGATRDLLQLSAVWAPVARRYHLNPMKIGTIEAWPRR